MSFNYGTSNFYFSLNLEDDEKQKTKFIKDIERIVRSSLEYRNYIKFLKTEALINYCSVLNKLPDDIVNSISIEMHHYPFTLYDIASITKVAATLQAVMFLEERGIIQLDKKAS
jgi:hypothetical protein